MGGEKLNDPVSAADRYVALEMCWRFHETRNTHKKNIDILRQWPRTSKS